MVPIMGVDLFYEPSHDSLVISVHIIRVWISQDSNTDWASFVSDLGEPLLYGLSLLHLGEVVVVEGHVGHDGFLIWMRDQHVLHLQQLHNPKFPVCHGEGVLQITTGVITVETAVIKEVRSEMSGGGRSGLKGVVKGDRKRECVCVCYLCA